MHNSGILLPAPYLNMDFKCRYHLGLLCILPVLLPLFADAQHHIVTGNIYATVGAVPLPGAVITAPGQQQPVVSDAQGAFSLSLPGDTATIRISYPGLGTKDTFLLLQDVPALHIYLEQPATQLDAVEIRGAKEERLSSQMGRMHLSAAEIASMPRFFGEADVMKALQTLPGVQQGSEGTSALLVRGGTPDQNLILLDGNPVYNPSHILGFFSSFNTYAIENVDLYKGAFPARFGGRLSSVVDIQLKEGNPEKIKGNFSLGLLSSQLTVEGPIKKGKTTFLLSGRRTYHDLYARPLAAVLEPTVKQLSLYFYDLHARLDHRFSSKDVLSFSAYAGGDKFRLKTFTEERENNTSSADYAISWGNTVAALAWKHTFSEALRFQVALGTTHYKFQTQIDNEDHFNGKISAYNLDLSSGIRDYSGRFNLDYKPSGQHSIKAGAVYTNHAFVPGSSFTRESSTSGIVSSTDIDSRIKATELDIYAEDDWEISSRLKANIGLHGSAFNVQDKWYTSLQPRLSMRYTLPGSWVLKASYARMAQYMHLLSSNSISLPTDLWVPATKDILPQQAQQLSLGFSRNLLHGQLELTVEGYYKAFDQVLEYKEGASFLVTRQEDNWEQKVTAGKGSSYGAELFLQKKSGRLTGWLGYTLAWANRTLPGVNNGKTFPYKYDRRHTFNLAATYRLKPGLELSGAFIYQTAAPFTIPVMQYENVIRTGTTLSYGTVNYLPGRNNIRVQAVHRLDLALNFIKEKKNGNVRTWSISVYNVYNRKNLFYYQVSDFTKDRINISGYSLMPILPSVSWQLRF